MNKDAVNKQDYKDDKEIVDLQSEIDFGSSVSSINLRAGGSSEGGSMPNFSNT